jgi:K+-sensing histidine kinase KdpD
MATPFRPAFGHLGDFVKKILFALARAWYTIKKSTAGGQERESGMEAVLRRLAKNDWLRTAAILAAATLLTGALSAFGIGRENLLMVFIVSVQCCAAVTHGYRYSVSAAVVGMMLFNYYFTKPLRTFAIDQKDDVTLLAFFLITAFLSAAMTARFREALEQSRAERSRAERLSAEKENARLEAERAHMKSSLLRGIGHDLRTPLTGIQCGVSYIADHADTLDRAELRRLAADISGQVGWLITLVENILYMTRIDNDRLEPNCQCEVVDDVVNDALSHVPELAARKFTVRLPESVTVVPMDGHMVVQVLVNLLENAVRHTSPECPIALSAAPAAGRMVFTVEDGGPGVPPAERERIFESFVTEGKTGPDGRPGMGLGLAICKAVAAAHRGGIAVDDSPALGGARFTFWLPMDAAAPADPPAPRAGNGKGETDES